MSQLSVSPALVLGVDGGGTKTVAWLARADGRTPPAVIGRGFSGPSNQRAVGPAVATMSLETAIAAAFHSAGVERQTVEAACFGLAGADRVSDRRVVETWARDGRIAGRVLVVNDARPLLHCGDMDGTGVALIAGTGSLALGREPGGRMARSGGWGWLIGDEGSAFAIGRAVLDRVTRGIDGRGAFSILHDLVLRHLSLTQPEELVAAVYGHEMPRSVIAGLAPLAFEAAQAGDPVASQLLDRAAGDLAELVQSVAARLQLAPPVPMALAGAVLVQQTDFRERVLKCLQDRGLNTGTVNVVREPVEGAIRMAANLVSDSSIAEPPAG